MEINVLVVDDDERKIALIKGYLLDQGVLDRCVHTAADAAIARKMLANSYYDLMLLDVLLPTRAGASPLAETSLEFLRQIVDDETARRPGVLVGITADSQALQDSEEEFRLLTTQIFHVDAGASDWRASLSLLLKKIRASETSQAVHDVDLCIQVALRKPELEAVLKELPVSWESEQVLSKGLLFRYGTFLCGEKQLKIVCAHATHMGMVPASHLAAILLEKFRPKILGMSGICGGIGEGMNLGDVVVAEKSWDWQSGKITANGDLQCAPDQKDASSDLVAIAGALEAELVTMHEACAAEGKPEKPPQLWVAPIVSGSCVVANHSIHPMLKAQHRKVGGIDMECYALYFEGLHFDRPPAKVLCIKAVSDHATHAKNDAVQFYCSAISARVLFEVSVRAL